MSSSIRFTSYDLLPGRVLTRIFEHLFWLPMRDHNMRALSLPLGHQALVPILSVSHSWRVRAAKLFYRVATVVAGNSSGGDLATWAIPTQRHMSLVKTNIELILNSGYAPKTTQLLVFSTETQSPTEMAATVSASRFCEFVWPSITHLYFYHPPVSVIESDMESANDTAIAALNHSLAVSMPRLSHINALSNTRDSFGLFALDDLIIAKLSQLRALTVLARVPLRLGAEELPRFLTRLTIRSSLTDSNIVSVPRTASASLISLDIGPVSPDDIWGPFSSSISDFTSLRELRLTFSANPAAARIPEDSRHRHLHKHWGRRSSRDSTTGNGWPLFPRLTALAVEGYPYETAYFLENFPRSQLTRLALRRCAHKISKFSLTPFTGLISFNGDVPDCNPTTTEGNEGAIEEWVAQTMQADMPTMRSLSLSVGPEIFIELPAQFGLSGLRHLTLNTGLRMPEVEKILLSFGLLRSLRVTVTEVLSRTHEYLSRTTRHKKYLPAELQERPWLSITLEDLEVWLLEPSPGRQHRALLRIVHMAMRIPSILRIATQREYLDELRELGQHMPAVQITNVSCSDTDKHMWC
ncbi:hypothetical protein IW146_000418 [Coemansia sp. RSA 922]|nr:hypothetical protein GGH13_000703 [Coemansia sp. S155-1]KAJ2117840.1 hypothetical protein IW146_000418 [Coemansia sp. RSA 922]